MEIPKNKMLSENDTSKKNGEFGNIIKNNLQQMIRWLFYESRQMPSELISLYPLR